MPWQDVITGTARYSVEAADRLEFFQALPADSVDLVFGSPPYEAARTYGVGFKLRGQEWVDWMVATFHAALRCCRGLVAFVLEGQTRNYRWSAVPALLMADLHRAGNNLRKPPVFHRVGIPGSGGPDWLRNDWEFIVCATRGGRLPWSDNTAMGHPPKWAPGGEMSNRLSDGQRVNQWGKCGTEAGVNGTAQRTRNGGRQKAVRPSHVMTTKRRATSGHKNGDTPNGDSYDPPALANPGNVLKYKVGGGLMGHALAHENEAPYPLDLAAFFVRSFGPPDGIVADCFSGSGTTLHASLLHGRRFVGADVRQSQVDLSLRRAATITPMLLET